MMESRRKGWRGKAETYNVAHEATFQRLQFAFPHLESSLRVPVIVGGLHDRNMVRFDPAGTLRHVGLFIWGNDS